MKHSCMTNRLRIPPRALPVLLVILLAWAAHTRLQAQPSAQRFSPSRPAAPVSADPVIVQDAQDVVAFCSPSGDNQIALLSAWIHDHADIIATDTCAGPLVYSMVVNGQVRDSAQVLADFLASFANGCGFQFLGNQTYSQVRGYVRVDWFVENNCAPDPIFAGQGIFVLRDMVGPAIVAPPITFETCSADDSLALRQWIDNHGNATLVDCSTPTWSDTISWATSEGQSGSGVIGTGPYPPPPPAHTCSWWVEVGFSASDDCGNSHSDTLRFEIQDTLAPVVTGYTLIDTLFCPQTLPDTLAASISENCSDGVTITRSVVYSDTLCTGRYTATIDWTVADACGNSTVATQTFLVRDTSAPVFSLLPAGFTASCHNFTEPPLPVAGVDVIATDSCGALDTILITRISTQSPNPVFCEHYTYTITRTFTAIDVCGNARTAQQVISVVDDQPPVFAGFTDTILVCEVQPVTPPPTASDLCSGVSQSPTLIDQIITAGDCGDSYTLTLLWQSTDGCDNIGLFEQQLHIQDTVKPTLSGIPADIFVECDAIPPPPANLVAQDNCDESPGIDLVETELRDPNPANCPHWTNYMIRREWTVSDNCGNSRTYTQNISVQDNTGPVIVPQNFVSLPNEPGVCGATISLPTPLALYDVCTSTDSLITLRDTVLLVNTTATTPAQLNNTPVDPVVFSWPSPNLPPNSPVVGPATLIVYLDSVDAESAGEFFTILGEDDYQLGITMPTASQCGNGSTTISIPANLMNSWLTDGILSITLAPFGTGSTAVNLVCAGGRARAQLTYTRVLQQIPPTITFSLDGSSPQPYPPSTGFFLPIGTHEVTYFASDCAGNTSSASTSLAVDDLEPPAIGAPGPITAYVGSGNCQATINLPFPTLSDNCGFSGNLLRSSNILAVQFENDPNAGWVPKTTLLPMSGLIPNAVTGGVLKIRHRGDNSQPGEFFEVLDEQDIPLIPATNYGTLAGECVLFNETTLNVSAAQINSWAANGTATFKLIPNTDAVTYQQFIGTCGPLNAMNFDTASAVEAVLTYNYAEVTYRILDASSALITAGNLIDSQTPVTLPPGVYTVEYRVTDGAGTPNVATFNLTVRDTIRPTAVCQPTTIFTNPSGAVGYTLQASEVDNGSTDNCPGNLSFAVSPSSFNCSQAGNVLPVTLTVTDAAGNTSTCGTQINVATMSFSPTVTSNACEGSTVLFFANPPGPPNIVYSYVWKRPNGATLATTANPTLSGATLADEGTYTVTITGPTGCTAQAVVSLDLINLPATPTLTTPTASLCAGQNLTLNTLPYSGSNVSYHWFEVTSSGNVPLGTTTLTSFQVVQPTLGTHQYVVQIFADNCSSNFSALLPVTVFASPTAAVSPAFVSICEGQLLALASTTQGPGVSYAWSGPLSFVSDQQQPIVTPSATLAREGLYTLVVTQNGCMSAPVTVEVDVRPKPATPMLSGTSSVCAGDTVQLTAIPTIGQFQWLAPDGDTVFTTINTLILPAVTPADSGAWRVRLVQNGCVSDASAPQLVQVQNYPQVTAMQAAPLCQGQSLPLAATSNMSNLTYNWTGPGGFEAVNVQNPVDPTPTSGTYTVTATTLFGCSSTSSITVSVITPPSVVVTNTAPPCADGTLNAQLQSIVFSPNPPLTYSWTGGPGGNFSSSEPNPVLPAITSQQNGTYTLVVTDHFGCVSNATSTVVAVEDSPGVPILAQPAAVCEGGTIILTITNPSNNPNVSYIWQTPSASTVTTQPSLTLLNATLQNNGQYSVYATTASCASSPSPAIDVTVNAIPPAPVISALNTNPCEGDTLQLIGPAGFTGYQWTGVNLTASVSSPSFPGVDSLMHSGIWRLRVLQNGCWSAASEPLEITVRRRPKQPIALPAAAVCLDQPDVLTLQITSNSAEPGAQFTWYNGVTHDTLGPPTYSYSFEADDLSGFAAGQQPVYVVASENGCSTPSTPILVDFNEIPNNSAFAGTTIAACTNQPIFLGATPPWPGTGQWTQVAGLPVSVLNPASNNSQVVGAVPNVHYEFAWTISAGACENYSSDTVSLGVTSPEQALVLSSFIDTCFGSCAQLHAVQGQSSSGYWTQPASQENPLNITIADSTDPHTLVCNLVPGSKYFFYWNIDNGACGISQAEVIVRSIGAEAYAGLDQSICSNDSCVLLTAADIGELETGVWTSPGNPGVMFSNATSESTVACNLRVGDNLFIWTTNNGLCGDRSRDSMTVRYELTPTTFPETITVPFGTTLPLDILDNDILPQQYSLEVIIGPQEGSFDQSTLMYQPDLDFVGDDRLHYRICNLSCVGEGSCSNETVAIIRVLEADGCEIPTLITPNGDNYNDEFFIPCIPDFPDNEVTIFNQWGDQVFHGQPYDNSWQGLFNGEPLPAGTYYFVVRFTKDKTGAKTGFLIIQR